MSEDEPFRVLRDLLGSWTEETFPSASRTGTDAALLSLLWWTLADSLFPQRSRRHHAVAKELDRLSREGRMGDPPLDALIADLARAGRRGVRPDVLAMAVCGLMDQLIVILPEPPRESWSRMADESGLRRAAQWHPEDEQEPDQSKLTRTATLAVAAAVEDAQRRGDSILSAVDLLTTLLNQRDTVAIRMLETLGIQPRDLLGEVTQVVPAGQQTLGKQLGADVLGRTIHQAQREAAGRRRRPITTGHLLLALTLLDEGPARGILAERGVSEQELREMLRRTLAASDEE